MRKYFSTIAAAGALALTALAATPAAAVTFVGSFNTQYHNGSSGGLNIDLSRSTGNLNFNLDSPFPFDFEVVKLFDIWAGESIGSDDFEADPFKINFTFTQPSVGGDVSGSTQGNFGWFVFPNYGSIDFTSPTDSFSFGGNGVMKVLVFADKGGNFGQGQNNSAGVYAKFYLEKMPTSAVPEPATWAMMISGFGLAGTAIRRRRAVLATA